MALTPSFITARALRLAVPVVLALICVSSLYGFWDRRLLPQATAPPETLTIHHPAPAAPAPAAAELSHTTNAVSTHPAHPNNPFPANPYTAIASIPDKVWHSAKSADLSPLQRDWLSSWTRVNPSFRQELLTDASGAAFVRAHYQSTRPDIVAVYEALQIPILRADLLRYLIVLAEGGVWSDLDVTCEKPVSEWVPPEYRDHYGNGNGIDMIVGLEFDLEWRGPDSEVASQFCNWVFAARPSSHNLQTTVDMVIDQINEIARAKGVSVSQITLDLLPLDVVNVTGPKMMTFAIMRHLRELLGRVVDDRDFAGTKKPILLGDVLIMPGNAFAAGQNGFPTDQGDALVSHLYEGSWKQADREAKERKKMMEEEWRQAEKEMEERKKKMEQEKNG